MGLLGHGGLGAVGEFDAVLDQRVGHGDHAAREVLVVASAIRQFEARRRLAVAGQQRIDVVGADGEAVRVLHGHLDHRIAALGARLGDQRQVRRRLAVVGGGGGLVVGERRRQRVRRRALAGEHIPVVIGAVLDLILGGKGLGLRFREPDVLQIAELDQVHGMTGRADFLVHLVAALSRRPVVGSEQALEGPVLNRRLGGGAGRLGRSGGQGQRRDGTGGENGREGGLDGWFHHFPYSAGCVTEAEMLSGRALGRSMTPRMGRITRRCAK